MLMDNSKLTKKHEPNEKESNESDKSNRTNFDEKEFSDRFEKTCASNCRVCLTGNAQKVQKMVATGMTYTQLVADLEKENGTVLSTASVSRHMSNYRATLRTAMVGKMYEVFDENAETAALHQSRVLFLARLAFDDIMLRYDAGHYHFSIDELDKLLKLFYQILKNPDQAGLPGVLSLFQQFDASFKPSQPVLFGRTGGPVLENKNPSEQGAESVPEAEATSAAQK